MPPHADEASEWVSTLMESRQTILPKRLVSPGPSAQQLQALFNAAAQAPDHGQLLPWRFVLIAEASRPLLAEVFAEALQTRDPNATAEQQSQAREKAFRAPFLCLVVVDGARGDPDIDFDERMISAGCALQNLLLMATAQGFGSALTSGKALKSAPLRALFGLGPLEKAVCFVSLGTVQTRKPARTRPSPADFVQTLHS